MKHSTSPGRRCTGPRPCARLGRRTKRGSGGFSRSRPRRETPMIRERAQSVLAVVACGVLATVVACAVEGRAQSAGTGEDPAERAMRDAATLVEPKADAAERAVTVSALVRTAVEARKAGKVD